MRTAVEFAISYANAPSCEILFSLAPGVIAGATCDHREQDNDFSSSINDLSERDEKFLKKFSHHLLRRRTLQDATHPASARKPVESGFNSVRPHFEHIP